MVQKSSDTAELSKGTISDAAPSQATLGHIANQLARNPQQRVSRDSEADERIPRSKFMQQPKTRTSQQKKGKVIGKRAPSQGRY